MVTVLTKTAGLLLRYLLLVWLCISALFIARALLLGNPVSMFLDQRLTPEHQTRLKQIFGYDQNIFNQYIQYLVSTSRGDLGISFTHKRGVDEVLAPKIGMSLWLGGISYLLGFVLCFALLFGIHGGPPIISKISRFATLVFVTVPAFLLGTFLLAVPGAKLGWFPIYGAQSLFLNDEHWGAVLSDRLYHTVLPALSLAIPLAGIFTTYLHGRLEELRNAAFVLSARGRGISETRIFFNHKLRAIRPSIVQLMGLYLPLVANGALLIEAMFGWSGMGLLLFEAVSARDYPLLMGGCLWMMIFVVIGYEIADNIQSRLTPDEADR